jgi:hypothetical protein
MSYCCIRFGRNCVLGSVGRWPDDSIPTIVMKAKSIDRPGKHHGNGVISDDAGLALARLFSSAAECGDAISCAKRIEAGAQLREAKERKREKNREARSRKKAARPIAKAIAARNWALNGYAEEVDVAPEYREFLNHLLHTMFGCEKRDNTLPLGIPIRIAAETIKVSAGKHAPIFRTALRLLIAEDKRSGQVPEQNISRRKRKRCTATLVQVGPEPQRKELEEVKEQLRAHNNRWQEKKSDDQLKRVDIDYPAPLEQAVLNWIERVQSLFPPLALEVRRSAFQYVRLGEAAIAKNFHDKLVKIEIFPPTTIRDLFSGDIEWREVSGE